MLQSRVGIEGYFVTYLDCIAAFEVPYFSTSVRARLICTLWIDLIFMHLRSLEVQQFGAS